MRRLAAMTLAVVVAACSGEGTGLGPTAMTPSPEATTVATPSIPATASPQPTVPPTRFDARVPLPDGGWLAARCAGTGSPTILLEAGGTRAGMQDWGPTLPLELARHTTVCRYSHRGADGSSAAPDPITWATVLDDADAVLDAVREQAGIDGPYLFVGWSFGGEVALGEAEAHRNDAAGIVILDTDFPQDFMASCLAAGRTRSDCQAEFDGDLEAKTIERDLVPTIAPMPDVPILLVSAIRPGSDCTVPPGSSGVSYSLNGSEVTAPDCQTLLQKVADIGMTQWGTIGTVTQTRVDADHDNLVRSAARQIADAIASFIAGLG